jgi:hypothetical protein
VLAQLSAVPVIVFHMIRNGLLNPRNELLMLLVVPAGMLVGKAAVLALGAIGVVDVAVATMTAVTDHLPAHAQVQPN